MKYLLALALLSASTVALGADLPAFNRPLVNSSGTFDSRQPHGPLLIEFFFEDCPSCRSNAPKVHTIASEYRNAVTVIDYGFDSDPVQYQQWIRRTNPLWPNHGLVDGGGSAMFDLLNVQSFPTTIIVDKDNHIVARYSGTWSRSTMNAIRRKLDSLQ